MSKQKLIVFTARTLRIPPIVAHGILLTIVSGALVFMFEPGAREFWTFVMYVMGVCVVVMLITWVLQGGARADWTKSPPWDRLE